MTVTIKDNHSLFTSDQVGLAQGVEVILTIVRER
jgi:hypothetical protein